MREVLAALAASAHARPNDLALADDNATLTFAQLAGHVANLAHSLQEAPQTIAIFAPNCTLWVIADLALALLGKTMVPLPVFFSADQLAHIIHDAGVELVLTTPAVEVLAQDLNAPCLVLDTHGDTLPFPTDLSPADLSARIIYTSGTTGSPKGVRIGASQISASARGLVQASGADANDRYLSILPFSLLLEQIAAICVPLLAGAPIQIEAHAAGAVMQGNVEPLIMAFAKHQPTASVMVPELLGAWVQGLLAMRTDAPKSLRFVAVGGAPVSPAVADTAWELGIPVHEGYGLSECCSVVSVNRPGQRQSGTVGTPIDGTEITLVDGEIMITGPTVMSGYLGREDTQEQTWATGDLGEMTEDGHLRILGRKDNLIVTQNGRNISPEWIETLALDAPGVVAAKLSLNKEDELVLTVTPHPHAQAHADWHGMEALIRACLTTAPDYAQPAKIVMTNVRTGP
ncbi:MAG: hypothetical protein COB59_04810 [Rhodospirillaceae bacterium]|nr:MAG: hypothetical protein COB59_04810 [Rhodospirillaceae bacterium]